VISHKKIITNPVPIEIISNSINRYEKLVYMN